MNLLDESLLRLIHFRLFHSKKNMFSHLKQFIIFFSCKFTNFKVYNVARVQKTFKYGFRFIVCNRTFVKGTGKQKNSNYFNQKLNLFMLLWRRRFSHSACNGAAAHHERAENNFIFFSLTEWKFSSNSQLRFIIGLSWVEKQEKKEIEIFSTVWLCVFSFSFLSLYFGWEFSRNELKFT